MDVQYLRGQIPTLEVLLELEPEELGAHIVEAMKRQGGISLPAHVRTAFYPDGGRISRDSPGTALLPAIKLSTRHGAGLKLRGF